MNSAANDASSSLVPPGLTPADAARGLFFYALSTAFVLGFMFLGRATGFVAETGLRRERPAAIDWPQTLIGPGGRSYLVIATQGYTFTRGARSNAAFFPAYPLLISALLRATGLSVWLAALCISQIAWAGACIVFSAYLKLRQQGQPKSFALWSLLAFTFFPTTLFFHALYSEALFVFCLALFMYALERRWPVLWVALVCGLATASRPVAVALAPAVLYYIWRLDYGRHLAAAWKSVVLTPVAVSGLLSYMAYLTAAFGDPLAFAHAQQQWCWREDWSLADKAAALASLEPVWCVYTSPEADYWRRREFVPHWIASMQLANPIIFLFTAVMIYVGALRRWLSAPEIILSALMLLIPYLLRSYEMYMAGHGRFAATVLPMYVVLGCILSRCHPLVGGVTMLVFGFFLAAYSLVFGGGGQIL